MASFEPDFTHSFMKNGESIGDKESDTKKLKVSKGRRQGP